MLGLVISSLFILRRGLGIAREVTSTGKHAAFWMLAVLGTVCAIAGTRVRGCEYVGVGMVVLAVVLEFLELRSKWTATEGTTPIPRE